MIPWESLKLWYGYPLKGASWPDVSKYLNDGAITGAFWEGDNLEFDGIDDYVNCGYMGSFGSEMSINKPTFIAWVKTSVTTRLVSILGTFNTGGTTGVQLTLNTNNAGGGVYAGYIRIYLRDENGLVLTGAVHTNTGITNGNWHHITASWDTPNNLLYIYVDSVLQTITYGAQQTPNNFADFEYPLWLAGINSRGALLYPFEGLISCIRLYNKILDAKQIKESYQQTYRLV